MATKIVWRLEDKDGMGIYRGNGYYYDATGDDYYENNTVERHPAPENDPQLEFWKIKNAHEYSFAFASLSQMYQWVYKAKWRKGLAELGVLLNKYEVDAAYYKRSPFQAIFNKKYAILIESRRPDYRDTI